MNHVINRSKKHEWDIELTCLWGLIKTNCNKINQNGVTKPLKRYDV